MYSETIDPVCSKLDALTAETLADITQADWSDPLPIPDALLPVEPFNVQLLPESLRGWVSDIAERMQCPVDFPAVSAMVALSSVIGRKASIKPKYLDDWEVMPNLWGAICGRPGLMKSPALSQALTPLNRLGAIASERHRESLEEYELQQKLVEMIGKKAEADAAKLIKSGDDEGARRVLSAANVKSEGKPKLRRYIVNDTTVEKLGEIHIDNPNGLLVYRDEINGLLKSMDAQGQEGARAFYLQGYDGNQSYTFDRIGRGENLLIPAVCLSLLGGIQPSKLRNYICDAVKGGTGDDGLLQRFGLLVWPDINRSWNDIDRSPDVSARNRAYAVFERLDTMSPDINAETGETRPAVYRFTNEAQESFREWRRNFEIDLRTEERHPALESHLAKYRKLVPAIALVCSLADEETAVSNTSLLRALAWADYLRSHAERIYASATRPSTEGAKALLSKIRSGHVSNRFKPQDIYWKGWAHLSNPEETHAAIGLLCDLNYLKRVTGDVTSKGGRPSTTVLIHPTLIGTES